MSYMKGQKLMIFSDAEHIIYIECIYTQRPKYTDISSE